MSSVNRDIGDRQQFYPLYEEQELVRAVYDHWAVRLFDLSTTGARAALTTTQQKSQQANTGTAARASAGRAVLNRITLLDPVVFQCF